MSDTRARIVAATNELFRVRGFNGTSLKQVSDQSAATTGSIYHFFPGGKDDLGAAVIRESGAAYQMLFELIADESTSIVDAVGGVFEGAAAVLEETDFIDICPIGSIAREVASTHDSLRTATVAVFAGWTEAVASRMGAAGLDQIEAEQLADTVIATLEGSFTLARARRSCAALRASGAHMQLLVASTIQP